MSKPVQTIIEDLLYPEDNKLSFLDYYGNLYVFSLEELLDLLKKS